MIFSKHTKPISYLKVNADVEPYPNAENGEAVINFQFKAGVLGAAG